MKRNEVLKDMLIETFGKKTRNNELFDGNCKYVTVCLTKDSEMIVHKPKIEFGEFAIVVRTEETNMEVKYDDIYNIDCCVYGEVWIRMFNNCCIKFIVK